MKCTDCENGVAWIDTSHQCGVYPIGDCCGGCGYEEKCGTCDGTGIINKECCICSVEYAGYGNNAAPVAEGRCCNDCNYTVVIPSRVENLLNKKND
jgi:hypothetical protein